MTRPTDNRFDLRTVLLTADNGHERAHAADALAKMDCGATWLREATRDDLPLVREAAFRGLARLDDSEAIALAVFASENDHVWWVRRTAVAALARLAQASAIDVLGRVLSDPFWRVRNAAVRALSLLGDDDRQVRLRILANPASDDNTRAALEYLRRCWSDSPAQSLTPSQPSYGATSDLYNDDPAVMAARLEDPTFAVRPALLIELLADPHEQLRTLAVARLASQANLQVVRAATIWLEEPRIPHAMTTVTTLLDGLGDRAETIARDVLTDDTSHWRSVCWALSWLARAQLADSRDLICRRLEDSSADVRAAAVTALIAVAHSRQTALLCLSHADDSDAGVREAVICALSHTDLAERVLGLVVASKQTLAGQRQLANIATRVGDTQYLREFAVASDACIRATALAALAAAGELPIEMAERAANDDDPWIRAAAINSTKRALIALCNDSDTHVQRTGLSWICDHQSELSPDDCAMASAAAASSDDPHQRMRVAQLVPAHDHTTLLQLSKDSHAMVRRAAVVAPVVRNHLETRLAQVLAECDERPSRPHVQTPRRRVEQPPIRINARTLGSTSVVVPPLVVSGAHGLSPAAFRYAFERGANAFFWEPRYLQLANFIQGNRARHDQMTIIAGSYEGSARGIRADVDNTLRRLRVKHIDVFLLFWVRSAERIDDDAFACLSALKQSGKVRAIGFSTHHRDLASAAIARHAWDAVMVRHSAAHTGAETTLLPEAAARGVGVLTFSALNYGRLLRGPAAPSAPDCYRYSLDQTGVTAVISAPRYRRELEQNLEVITSPNLLPEQRQTLRAHGSRVYVDSKEFAALVRRNPTEIPADSARRLQQLVDAIATEPRGL